MKKSIDNGKESNSSFIRHRRASAPVNLVVMHKNLKKPALYLSVVTTVFAAGFLIGTRVGVEQFTYADAQYKASMLAGEIKAMKQGRAEALIPTREILLDSELEKHGRYMDSSFKWLFPELRSEDDRPIKGAVAYRLANPFIGPDLSKPDSWNPGIQMDDPFVVAAIKGQNQGRQYRERVLNAYGGELHNSSVNPGAPNSARR